MKAEEIVKKYCIHQGYGNFSVKEDKLIDAITSYAEQQAKEFGEWLENSDWEFYDSTAKGHIYKSMDYSERKTMTEIYKIWKEEQKP